jgi:hypothetical protein
VPVVTTPKKYGPLLRRLELQRIGRLNAGVIRAAEKGAKVIVKRALPKYLGNMRRAVTVRVYNRGVAHARSMVVCEIIVDVPYAKAIEYGTRPFTPPIAPLHMWAMVKLGLPYEEALRTAYAIRHTFSVFGMQPNFYVRDVKPQLAALLEPFLRQAFESARVR